VTTSTLTDGTNGVVDGTRSTLVDAVTVPSGAAGTAAGTANGNGDPTLPESTDGGEPPPFNGEELYIIDALNLLYRAYHALNAVSPGGGAGGALGAGDTGLDGGSGGGGGGRDGAAAPPDGRVVNLFITMLMTLLERHATHHRVVIVFDATHRGAVVDFRRALDPAYKAHRAAMPPGLRAGIPYAKRLVHALGLPLVEVPSFEADDVVATLAGLARRHGARSVVVSMDKDFLQLLEADDWVRLLRPNRAAQGGRYSFVTAADFAVAHAGLAPRQFVDVLALMGDAADGVPGVKGIGAKIAPRLIAEYGGVEPLLAAATAVVAGTPPAATTRRSGAAAAAGAAGGGAKPALTVRLAKLLDASAARLRLSRRLVEIKRDVALEGVGWAALARARVRPDAVRSVLSSLGLSHKFSGRFQKLDDALAAAHAPVVDVASASAVVEVAAAPGAGERVAYLSPISADDVRGPPGGPGLGVGTEEAAVQAGHDDRLAAMEDPGASPTAAALPAAPAAAADDTPTEYTVLSDTRALALHLALHVQERVGLAFAYAPGGPTDGRPGTVVGMAISVAPGRAVYVPLPDPTATDGTPSLAPGGILAALLTDTSVGKVGWFLADAHKALAAVGVRLRGRLFDVRLGHSVLHAGSGARDGDVLRETLGLDDDAAAARVGWPDGSLGVLAPPTAAAAAHAQADYGLRVAVRLRAALAATGLERVATDVEMPLLQPLADMEAAGIAVDGRVLADLRVDVDAELASISGEIERTCAAAGPEAAALVAAGVNVGSSAQLAALLTALGAGLRRTTARNAVSVSAAVLAKLSASPTKEALAAAAAADGYTLGDGGDGAAAPPADGVVRRRRRRSGAPPASRRAAWEKAPTAAAAVVARLAGAYRSLARLRVAYTDSLAALIDPATGRIHTTYVQNGSATGRTATVRPNLQSLPTRSPLGRRVRAAVVAPPGTVLLAADYAQIELRILAALSGDAALIAALGAGEDVHRSLAAAIFDTPPADVTAEQRSRAKLVSYGVPYGVSAAQLGAKLGVSLPRARALIAAFHARFPRVRAYTTELVARARAAGYTQTLLGRRRPLPALAAANGGERAAAERAAVNAPIQGTQADLLKVALARVDRRLRAGRLASRLVLQVHDEVLVEVAAGEEPAVRAVVRQEMEAAVALPNGVAIRVDIGVGGSWRDAAPH